MDFSDYIAIASLIVSTIAIIYSCKTNTKRYELSDQYRKDILAWYKETIFIIKKIKEKIVDSMFEINEKHDLLSQLSALIEYGRFYFPNNCKDIDKGKDKPLAFRGERNMTLNLLVYIYDAVKQPERIEEHITKAGGVLQYIELRERWFTSIIYKIVDPLKWIKNRSQLVDVVNVEDIPLAEYHSVDKKIQ